MKLDDQTHAPLPCLPPREPDSHKGDYGRALLIGGSCGMAGAISLAGRATLRSGAGLVTLAVPRCVQNVVASFEASYMTRGLADDDGHFTATAIDEMLELLRSATIVAVGPGLGRAPVLTELVARLYREIDKPMVVDADGLFALAEAFGILSEAGGPRVLTPHPGEFARFTNHAPNGDERVAAAAALAQKDSTGRTIVVLKGRETIVTDGLHFSVNQTGNPGMATGGTGDVLTGIITGFLCQGMAPFDAARLAVYLHGAAGDAAAEHVGQVSLIATDVIDYIPNVIQFHERTHESLESNFRR
jgi:NAD(P)H-hydrate epimerase